MSSSSGPEDHDQPHLDVEALEETEQLEHEEHRHAEAALGDIKVAKARSRRDGWITAAWATPGTLWLLFFLVAPLVMILLVSFWTTDITGFKKDFTLEAYRQLFGSLSYWNQMKESFFVTCIVVLACLILGFPIAYFLSFKVKSLKYQLALFIVITAPFLTSYLIRITAWTYPVMGRQGALNQLLEKLGLIDDAVINPFSTYSVTLAMIQLYILMMISPIFFLLAQVDRSSLEAARDLGASWFKSFREVIVPQAMPGIVIGSIFVFVLAMGDYGTYRVVGAGQVSSVSLIVQNNVVGLQYPLAAASAVFLVVAMMLGVFALLQFAKLREEL
ncbi:MAG: ABC transporter permease [Gaiellales bacterium]